MYVSNANTNGRPKEKGSLRNFRFRKQLDEFLTKEAGTDKATGKRGRTGKDMTLYLEQALGLLMKLKPSDRDAEMAKALSE